MCISTPGSIVTFPSTYLTNCEYTLSGLFFHLLNWDIYSVFTLLMINHIMATIVKSFLGEENCTSAQFSQTFLVIPMRVIEMQLNFRNTPVLGRGSITAMKQTPWPEASWGRKGFHFHCSSWKEGRQDRKNSKQELIQRPWSGAAYWLPPHGLLSPFSYWTQDHQPKLHSNPHS